MILDNVLAIRKAESDSQFRLRACEKCGGDNVAYVLHENDSKKAWHAQCFDCGHIGADDPTQHGAQVRWNRTMLGAVVV